MREQYSPTNKNKNNCNTINIKLNPYMICIFAILMTITSGFIIKNII